MPLKDKEAHAEYCRQYYQKNKAQVKSKVSEYRDAHREEYRQYFRDRYAENRDDILVMQKEHHQKYPEKTKAHGKRR